MSANANRSRQNNRKRAHGHDDASYNANISIGHGRKQHGTPTEEGRAPKRKRMEDDAGVVETAKISLIDFGNLPGPSIHRYLNHFEIVPVIRPLPTTAEDPPPPNALLNPGLYREEDTATGRPRRNQSTPTIHRRPPILADVAELNVAMAGLAERHFKALFWGERVGITGREEVDTLAAFMCAVENGQRGNGICRRK